MYYIHNKKHYDLFSYHENDLHDMKIIGTYSLQNKSPLYEIKNQLIVGFVTF